MSLKQNVDYIKTEINNDEKMLEGLIRFEGWFKRYKIPLLVAFVLVVILAVGYEINNLYVQNQQDKLALLYDKALSGDEEALKSLEKSQSRLYDLYRFSKAIQAGDKETLKLLQSSQDEMIAKLAKYQYASLTQDLATLDSSLSGELGYLQAAFLEIQKGNTKEAKNILSKIQINSPTKEIAEMLEHLNLGVPYEKE